MVCIVPAVLLTRLTSSISLQLSTSIAMPFNPYRSYRVPDHLNRSRYPVTMPHQQNRGLPVRAASFDGWQNQPPNRTPYQPSYATTVNSQVTYNQFNGHVASSSIYAPKSTDLSGSYFAANQTPDMQEPSGFWDGGKNSNSNSNWRS